jgi:type VI secretion system protein ImpC
VSRTETGPLLRLKVLDVAKSELCEDMDGAAEPGRGTLARMLRDAASGIDGGFPYSLLVGDYEFGDSGADVALLGKIAEVAASTNTSFIAAASCSGFGLDSVDPLAPPRDLDSVLQADGLMSWREWRAQDVSHYVTLALPRVLLRLPHDGLECTDFLWGNAVWVLAERVTHAFALYAWPAAIRGVDGGGLVENFPLCGATPDTGAAHQLCPTEVVVSDRYDKELAALGLMPLYHIRGTAHAAFLGGQADHAPKPRFFSDVRANAGLSTTLPYVLAASRFAHYLKVIMRKKAGMTRAGVESRLNDWLASYVLLDDNASHDVKAAFPLRAANVVVTEAVGQPARHTATVFIKPHFQLEEWPNSIRLVVPLPA